MPTISNLWNDLEALSRLALTARDSERQPRGARAGRSRWPTADEAPLLDDRRFAIHGAEAPSRVVNGDFFDFFPVSRSELAFVIADVSGKGMPAALLRSFARSMVRNVSARSGSPGDTLGRVNRMLYDAKLGSMFVTIFLGWFSPRTGALRYASAGHPRPYLLDRQGWAAPFGEVTGPILGILDVERYEEARGRLAPGERLILYTDGVTEAESPEGDFFGHARLADLLARRASDPPGHLGPAILRRIADFQGPRTHDDATVLVLERKA